MAAAFEVYGKTQGQPQNSTPSTHSFELTDIGFSDPDTRKNPIEVSFTRRARVKAGCMNDGDLKSSMENLDSCFPGQATTWLTQELTRASRNGFRKADNGIEEKM